MLNFNHFSSRKYFGWCSQISFLTSTLLALDEEIQFSYWCYYKNRSPNYQIKMLIMRKHSKANGRQMQVQSIVGWNETRGMTRSQKTPQAWLTFKASDGSGKMRMVPNWKCVIKSLVTRVWAELRSWSGLRLRERELQTTLIRILHKPTENKEQKQSFQEFGDFKGWEA